MAAGAADTLAAVPGLPHEDVRFAHNSERQFAKLLDFYGIAWEYEPREFILEWDREGNPQQAFRPDFYLPAYDLYIEITTLNQKLVTKKNGKVRRLRELHPEVKVKIFYQRDYLNLLVKYGLEQPSQLACRPLVDEPGRSRFDFGARPESRRTRPMTRVARRSTPPTGRSAPRWCRSAAGTCRCPTRAARWPSTGRAGPGRGLRRQPPRHRAGRGARRARLQRTLTNDLGKIGPGRAQYTHLLDEADASVLDDIIVWWVDDERFDVMPNASNTDRVARRHRRRRRHRRAGDHRRAGPEARRLLEAVAPGRGRRAPVRRAPLRLEGRTVHRGRHRLHRARTASSARCPLTSRPRSGRR